MDVLFPLPDGRRNADDMGMPSPVDPSRVFNEPTLAQMLAAMKERAERAEVERDALRAERDTFYMEYRMKCDSETKALTADNERLREQLQAEVAMHRAAERALEQCRNLLRLECESVDPLRDRAERAEAERDEFSRSIDRICTERDKQLLRVAAERDELRTYSGRLRALLRRSQEPMTADQWAAWHRDTAAALAEGK